MKKRKKKEDQNLQLRNIRAIISGGGTGGHIFPAVAIANELKKVNPQNEILFVGAIGRMEMEKVPAAGYKIVGLDIRGFQRSFSLSNFLLPFKILKSLLKARTIVKEFKPDIAIGVGGYASGPLLYAASSAGIPSLIQEQNSFAGITNKLLGRRVQRICVAYDGMEKYFPAEKIVLTGNPVRRDAITIEGKKDEALKFFGLQSDKKTVVVIGGSLGARTINQAVASGLKKIVAAGYQLIWQTGKPFAEQAAKVVADVNDPGIKTFPFIQRMDLVFACADLVISRAGASSVSELTLTGKPCILVPSPNVAEDHQTKNAMALVQNDAAVLVKDANASAELIDTAIKIMSDKNRLETLSVNIRKMALPDSAGLIVNEIYRLIN